jgi:pimeloyl-ACP methyl ester carboxylesterase
MPETPATHYVKSDGIHIAYQVLGQGPFDLLFVPGFVSNVEATWRLPNFSAFFRRLASFCRVILFDKRGTGMSDRGSQIFTLEQRMHDVQAVLDEVGSKQAALFGVFRGRSNVLAMPPPTRSAPPRFVLYGSYAKRSWAPDYPFGWDDEQWQRVLDDIEHHWGTPRAQHLHAPAERRPGPRYRGRNSVVLPGIGESWRGGCDHANEPRHRCARGAVGRARAHSHPASNSRPGDRRRACSVSGAAHLGRSADRVSGRSSLPLAGRSRRNPGRG